MEITILTLDQILASSGVTTQQETTKELLEKYGLNWNVSKQPLILPSGSESGFYGIVREDTQKVFTTCKEGYEPYQNSELLELVNESAKNVGLSVTNGGKFKDGGLVYLQLNTGSVRGIGINNDTIDKNITAINSHDGSTALRWGITNITISCRNTFWSAYRSLKNSVKHTQSMRGRIDAIAREIEKVQQVEEDLYSTFFKFAEVKATKEHIQKAVSLTLDIDMIGGKKSELTQYEVNRLNDLSSSIAREMKQKGDTVWGLFSGVTRYTTHLMPGGDVNRQQSKAVGMGYDVDNKVYSHFAELVA